MNLDTLDWIKFCNQQKMLSKVIVWVIFFVGLGLLAYAKISETFVCGHFGSACLLIAVAFTITGVEPWTRNKYSFPGSHDSAADK